MLSKIFVFVYLTVLLGLYVSRPQPRRIKTLVERARAQDKRKR